jgi:hypothetical protein
MKMYKKYNVILNGLVISENKYIERINDGALIPFDPANTDYQAYLKWLSEGNTPLSADEPTPAEETNI